MVVASHSPTLGMAFRDGARRKYMNICKKTGYSTPKNKGERKLELYTTEDYIIKYINKLYETFYAKFTMAHHEPGALW